MSYTFLLPILIGGSIQYVKNWDTFNKTDKQIKESTSENKEVENLLTLLSYVERDEDTINSYLNDLVDRSKSGTDFSKFVSKDYLQDFKDFRSNVNEAKLPFAVKNVVISTLASLAIGLGGDDLDRASEVVSSILANPIEMGGETKVPSYIINDFMEDNPEIFDTMEKIFKSSDLAKKLKGPDNPRYGYTSSELEIQGTTQEAINYHEFIVNFMNSSDLDNLEASDVVEGYFDLLKSQGFFFDDNIKINND